MELPRSASRSFKLELLEALLGSSICNMMGVCVFACSCLAQNSIDLTKITHGMNIVTSHTEYSRYAEQR
jgi:hypothetical protein